MSLVVRGVWLAALALLVVALALAAHAEHDITKKIAASVTEQYKATGVVCTPEGMVHALDGRDSQPPAREQPDHDRPEQSHPVPRPEGSITERNPERHKQEQESEEQERECQPRSHRRPPRLWLLIALTPCSSSTSSITPTSSRGARLRRSGRSSRN